MSDIYAWYSLFGTAGTALGMMVCGWVLSVLQDNKHWDFVPACRVVFMLYAVVGAIKFVLTVGLSSNIEAEKKPKKQQQQQQDPPNAIATETDPLLGTSQEQPEEERFTPAPRKIFFLPGVEAQFVGLVTSLLLFFALDSFGSSLASLFVSSSVSPSLSILYPF